MPAGDFTRCTPRCRAPPCRLVALRNAPGPHPGLLGELFPHLVAAMAKSTEHIAVGGTQLFYLAVSTLRGHGASHQKA